MDTVNPIDSEHVALAEQLAAEGVQYVLGGWIDIVGRSKSKVVPISHLPNLLAGSERYTPRGMGDLGRMTPNEDECVALPDLSTLRVCPWDRRVAWTAADLLFAGREPFALCTRSILKRQLGAGRRGRASSSTSASSPSCSSSGPNRSTSRPATWSRSP